MESFSILRYTYLLLFIEVLSLSDFYSYAFKLGSEANLKKIHEKLGIVKLRSCRPYGQLYSLAEFVIQRFNGTIETELGYSTDQLWDFFDGPHATAIRSVHVEQNNAVNNIRC